MPQGMPYDVMFTRGEYLATKGDDATRAAAHRRFYAQFVNESTVNTVALHIGRDRLRASADPYFNDIPLGEWDGLCGYRQRGSDVTRWGPPAFPYSQVWKLVGDVPSLGTLVCIAKEAARQYVEGADA